MNVNGCFVPGADIEKLYIFTTTIRIGVKSLIGCLRSGIIVWKIRDRWYRNALINVIMITFRDVVGMLMSALNVK